MDYLFTYLIRKTTVGENDFENCFTLASNSNNFYFILFFIHN